MHADFSKAMRSCSKMMATSCDTWQEPFLAYSEARLAHSSCSSLDCVRHSVNSQDAWRAVILVHACRSRAKYSFAMPRQTRAACTSKSQRRRPTGSAQRSSSLGGHCHGFASFSTTMPPQTHRTSLPHCKFSTCAARLCASACLLML